MTEIIILGMHRSGTSCLAGCLQEAHLFLGKVNKGSPDNVRGSCENFAIMRFHEALLAENGGSWDCPPERVTWSAQKEARRAALIASYPKNGAWGFKDPRTLLTMEGWLKALPSARCVGTFRHPFAVVRSLQRRNDFPLEKGLNLWLRYNRELLRYNEAMRFPLVNFDLPAEIYRAKLAMVARDLGLAVGNCKFSFFDAALRREERQSEDDLPDEIKSIYAHLLERQV